MTPVGSALYRRWYVVALFAIFYVLSCIDRFILVMLVDPVKGELGLSDTQMAILIGPAFALMYSMLGLPVAWLVDRANRTWIVAGGVLLWCCATFASAFVSSFGWLVVLRIGVALGEAVLSPAAVSLIADYFPRDRRSTPVAAFVAAGVVGITLAYAAGGAIITLVGGGHLQGWPLIGGMPVWRATLVIVATPGILLALLLLMTTREPVRGALDQGAAETADAAASALSAQSGAFPDRRTAIAFYALFFIGCAITTILSYGVMSWYPTYLVRGFGIDIARSGYLFSPALLVSAGVGFLLPMVAQAIGRKGRRDMLLPIALVVLIAGWATFLLSFHQTDLIVSTMFAVIGFGCMAGTTGLPMIAVALTAPPALRGRLISVNLACAAILGMGIGPYAVAQMASNMFTGPRALGDALYLLSCIVVPLAALLIFLAWRPFRHAMAR